MSKDAGPICLTFDVTYLHKKKWKIKLVGKTGQQTEKASKKVEDEQMQMETLTMIAIIEEKWAGVMAKDQAGYFGHELPGVAESNVGDNPSGFSVPSDQGKWGRYEDDGTSPFSHQRREDGTSMAEAYPCP